MSAIDDVAGVLFYKTHPAVRLIFFLSMIQMAAVSSALIGLSVFTLFFILLYLYLKIGKNIFFSKLKPFVFILLFTFIINLLFGSSITSSFILTYRFLLIISFSIMLTITTPAETLVAVITAPFKGKHAENMKIVLMIALKTIPAFIDIVKNTAAHIRTLPQFKGKMYLAIFSPDTYIPPVINSLLDMAQDTSDGITNGDFQTETLSGLSVTDMGLSLLFVIMAVLYAL